MTSSVKGLAAAVFYGVCSVATAFANKALMTTMEFDYPVFIMAMQMLYTVIILELLKALKLISIRKFTLHRAKAFIWPSLFYGSNAIFALSALSHMNIAMYGVLKRCTPLSTMLLAMVVLKKGLPSLQTMGAVVLLTAGLFVAGYGDLTFDLSAYFRGGVSIFTQSMYLLLVQKYSDKDQSTLETLHLNSYITFPFIFTACIFTGELASLSQYSHFSNAHFFPLFILVISMGCLLNFSLFMCTGLTSALTTTVVGSLKTTVQTALGFVTFGGVSHNVATYAGIFMNFLGGLLYIYFKHTEQSRKQNKNHRDLPLMTDTTQRNHNQK